MYKGEDNKMQETIGIIMLLALAFGILSLMWRSGGIKETLAIIGITAAIVGWVVIALKLIFG